jgi:hypothetical protein
MPAMQLFKDCGDTTPIVIPAGFWWESRVLRTTGPPLKACGGDELETSTYKADYTAFETAVVPALVENFRENGAIY